MHLYPHPLDGGATVIIVRSLDKNDCGTCALACATGRSWVQARAAIASGRARRGVKEPEHLTSGTSGRDLIDGALRLGWVGDRCRPVKVDWSNFVVETPQFAIVKVQYADVRVSHWVAYQDFTVYDSNYPDPMRGCEYFFAPLSGIIFKPAANDL